MAKERISTTPRFTKSNVLAKRNSMLAFKTNVNGMDCGVYLMPDLELVCACGAPSDSWCDHRAQVLFGRLDQEVVPTLIAKWDADALTNVPVSVHPVIIPLTPSDGVFQQVLLEDNGRGRIVVHIRAELQESTVESTTVLGILAEGDGIQAIRELVLEHFKVVFRKPLQCSHKKHNYLSEMAVRAIEASGDRSAIFKNKWSIYNTKSCTHCAGPGSTKPMSSFEDTLIDEDVFAGRSGIWKDKA